MNWLIFLDMIMLFAFLWAIGHWVLVWKLLDDPNLKSLKIGYTLYAMTLIPLAYVFGRFAA